MSITANQIRDLKMRDWKDQKELMRTTTAQIERIRGIKRKLSVLPHLEQGPSIKFKCDERRERKEDGESSAFSNHSKKSDDLPGESMEQDVDMDEESQDEARKIKQFGSNGHLLLAGSSLILSQEILDMIPKDRVGMGDSIVPEEMLKMYKEPSKALILWQPPKDPLKRQIGELETGKAKRPRNKAITEDMELDES